MNDEAVGLGENTDEDFDPVASLSVPLMRKILDEVSRARSVEDNIHGFFRDYPNGTAGQMVSGPTLARERQNAREAETREKTAGGRLTWRHQIEAAVMLMIAEENEAKLRVRLVHLAALTVSWVEALDRRKDEKRIEKKMRPTAGSRLARWWLRRTWWPF